MVTYDYCHTKQTFLMLNCPIFQNVYIHMYSIPSCTGEDFTIPDQSISLSPGTTQQRLTIPITNDQILENMETFSITISVLDKGTTVQPNSTTISIEDDDSELVGVIHTIPIPVQSVSYRYHFIVHRY